MHNCSIGALCQSSDTTDIRIRIGMGNLILRGSGKFDDGRSPEELEEDQVEEEDLVKAEKEYERVWGGGGEEYMGEGGNSKRAEGETDQVREER